MKKLLAVVAVLAMVAVASPAMAWGGSIIETNNYDYDITNKGGNATSNNDIDVEVGNGFGNFSPKANAEVKNFNTNKIEEGAVKNFNTDVNVNTNKQQQGQIQGQAQKQGQAQGQMNNWEQTFEDKRDHIQGPELMRSDAKFAHGYANDAKTYGIELLDEVDFLYMSQAKMLSKETTGVKITKNVMFKNSFETSRVYIRKTDKRGKFMGYFYGECKNKKCNAAGMVGEAAEQAMKIGATHVIFIKQSDGKEAEGGSWNIGIGGGASIMSNSETVAVAPNGGLGFGKAKAYNEMRPAMVFSIWYDEDTVQR